RRVRPHLRRGLDAFRRRRPFGRARLDGNAAGVHHRGDRLFRVHSGFLYRQVFFGRIAYGDFMRKKALYVGLPYLVLGVPLALLEIAVGNYGVILNKQGEFYGSGVFMDMVVLLTTGRMATAYWYIPFIFIVFLASPLFDRFIRQSNSRKLAILTATIAVAF